MGHGKTTVIAPLLALMLASRDALVTVCVPDALVGMSQRALAAALGGLWRRRVASVAFSRHSLGDVDPVGGARRLRRRLELARRLCAPVVATASTLKALVLRVVELAGRQCDAFGCETDGEFVSRAHERAELAELRGAVALFGAAERGVLLLDKVDVLLHALKSELNFPVGDDAPLELSDERSDIVLRLVSLVFDGHDKDVAECVERMIERCEMSREPHLLLVDRAAYAQHLQPTMARALLAWLRTQLRRHGTAFATVRIVDRRGTMTTAQSAMQRAVFGRLPMAHWLTTARRGGVRVWPRHRCRSTFCRSRRFSAHLDRPFCPATCAST